jgi:hypothetical protein
MNILKQVPVTTEHVEIMPDYDSFKEGVIYVSLKYDVAIHKCLCGCKGKTVTPLGKGEWTLTENEKGVTITPSIGNFSGEKPYHAHYIITNGIANFV